LKKFAEENVMQPITTIEGAMDFIYGTSWKGSVFGLSRITELLNLLENPQKKLKFVHIAGTNGKGSTSAMLASVLTQAGYKTGLYTSPFIENFSELIQVNGVAISDDELILLTDFLQKFTSQMKDAPTEYEIITTMAFLHFYRKDCDIVVLEVGMGGRLDSTNVIDVPEVAVITAIGLDHMVQLGNTAEKIAAEKAGIIKKNGAVVCHPQISSVEAVLREKCKEENASVCFVKNEDISPIESTLDGQAFNYSLMKNVKIPLLGEHQLRNAAVVIEAIKVLLQKGWNISEYALKNGLENTIWHGRFEVMRKRPLFIVDVAHNPQGIQATLDTFLNFDKKIIFIFGVLADKDYKKMAELLTPHAKNLILVTPENPRALPAKKLEQCIKNFPAIVCETIEDGVNHALATAENDDIICALGSLSMIGKIRRLVK
jgi:dihydrofolate synthase/folylpolyglutamate synthase